MMIVMQPGASKEEVQDVVKEIGERGLNSHVIEGVERTVIGAVGDSHTVSTDAFSVLPGVESVMRISQPYKLASRQFKPENTVIPFNGFSVGAEEIGIIAGPCSVESRTQLIEVAHAVREA